MEAYVLPFVSFGGVAGRQADECRAVGVGADPFGNVETMDRI